MLDFPSAPTVGQKYPQPPLAGVPVYSWDGEKWTTPTQTGIGAVRYDMPQGLTINQMAQGRSNIGSLKKNYIINGAMMVSQENGATAGTANGYYAVDQISLSGIGSYTAQQVASPTPAGSPNRLRVTVTAAHTVAANDLIWLEDRLEGLRVADLRYGSAAAKTTTLQIGVKAPAGTYCIAFVNIAGAPRSYVAEYVVAAGEANTDTVKTVTIPGDVAGTWVADNTTGLVVRWALMAGTNYQQTAGSWQSSGITASPNQFNLFGTNGNTFELFDVGLYEGAVAPPFMVPDYASELALCMRYYEKGTQNFISYMAASGYLGVQVTFRAMKRALPTLSALPVAVTNATVLAVDTAATDGCRMTVQATATGAVSLGATWTANARL
jgi:hypothetical protein